MYKIHYSYNTGDSFGTQEGLRGEVEYEWTNLDCAKESLKRINEHYRWYGKLHGDRFYRGKYDEIIAEGKANRWYVDKYDFCLVLIDDLGNPFQYQTCWCGYFESLNWAKIMSKPDSDMEINFESEY